MPKKELKKYKQVLKILQEVDPLGLMAAGIPYHQRSFEIFLILDKLKTCWNVENVYQAIKDIFDNTLGCNLGFQKKHRQIAKKVWKLKKSMI